MRWVEVGALAAVAWAVAVPVTVWFAGRRAVVREPVAALVTWQAIGLCGGLATLTGELSLAAVGRPGRWRDAVVAAVRSPDAVAWAGLVLFALTLAWLVAVLVASFVGSVRARREHRTLLQLLRSPAESDGVDTIEADAPVAYSVPGRSAHVVVSTATRRTLTPGALAAVIAHERAHLRQRHAVLVEPFVAWQRSLPFLRAPVLARARVGELVEMVCDGAAVRATSVADTRAALHALVPDGAARQERLARLGEPRDPVGRAVLLGAAVVLVAAAPVVLVLAG